MYSLIRSSLIAAMMVTLSVTPGSAGILPAGFVANVPAVAGRMPALPGGQAKEAGSITGRVTIEGSPAAGITVLLLDESGGQIERPITKATADQDGRYRLAGVPAGQYMLQAFAPAFAPQSTSFGRVGRIINIAAGEALEGENIDLIRGGVITGKVVDVEGHPLILERVRLMRVVDGGRAVQTFPTFPQFIATDDRGTYRIYGLAAGRYIVAVGVDNVVSMTRITQGNTYHSLTYHPDAAEEANAKVIELSTGSEATGVDIIIGRVAKAFSATGRLIDADTGRPIVAVPLGISALNVEGRSIYSTSSQAYTSGVKGEFRIDGLTPGEYSVYAFPGPDSDLASDATRFSIGEADVTGLEVKVRRGSTMFGNVVIEGGEEKKAPRPSEVRLGISSSSMNVAARSVMVKISPDGSFRVAGLPRGVANFIVYTYPTNKGLTLARVERDGVEQKGGIDVGIGEEITGVKVVFAFGTGRIRGQIKDVNGELLGDAYSMFLSLRRLGANSQPGRMPLPPDSRGRFAIDGLLSGEYEIHLTVQPKPVPGGTQLMTKSVIQTVSVTDSNETQVTLVVNLKEKDQ